MQHANDAVDEVRRAEFLRQGKTRWGLIKRKKWLLLSLWRNLSGPRRGELNRLFRINRRVFKAYLLKESLERLWTYRYARAMTNYLKKWMSQLKWQRLIAFEKLAGTLLKHLDGILNYCHTKVRFGVVEAVNGNIPMLINRGRGYTNLRYLLLKAKNIAVANIQFMTFQTKKKRPKINPSVGFLLRATKSLRSAEILAATPGYHSFEAQCDAFERAAK